MKTKVLMVLAQMAAGLVMTLVLTGCVESTFTLALPAGAQVEGTTLGQAPCWYAGSHARAPASVNVQVNASAWRASIEVSDLSRVSRSGDATHPTLICSTQWVMEGAGYRLPGAGDTADSGFVVFIIYMAADAATNDYSISVSEYRLVGSGPRASLDILSWTDPSNMSGRELHHFTPPSR